MIRIKKWSLVPALKVGYGNYTWVNINILY